MTNTLPLQPPEPLTQHRDQAEKRLNAAREKHHHIQMLTMAHVVTAALPEATSIDVARNLFDFQQELWLEAIHAADGTLLWHDEHIPDPLGHFHYADGTTWTDASKALPDTIVDVLAGADLADVALTRPDWSQLDSSGPIELVRIHLPNQQVLEHYRSTPPVPTHTPRVEVVTERSSDRATEAHVFLDGTPAPAELTDITPAHDGTTHAGHEHIKRAAAASPAAAKRITHLLDDASTFGTT